MQKGVHTLCVAPGSSGTAPAAGRWQRRGSLILGALNQIRHLHLRVADLVVVRLRLLVAVHHPASNVQWHHMTVSLPQSTAPTASIAPSTHLQPVDRHAAIRPGPEQHMHKRAPGQLASPEVPPRTLCYRVGPRTACGRRRAPRLLGRSSPARRPRCTACPAAGCRSLRLQCSAPQELQLQKHSDRHCKVDSLTRPYRAMLLCLMQGCCN